MNKYLKILGIVALVVIPGTCIIIGGMAVKKMIDKKKLTTKTASV